MPALPARRAAIAAEHRLAGHRPQIIALQRYELVVADNIEPVVLGPVAVPVLERQGAIAAAIEALGGVDRRVDEVVGEHLRADPPAVLRIERDVAVVWTRRENGSPPSLAPGDSSSISFLKSSLRTVLLFTPLARIPDITPVTPRGPPRHPGRTRRAHLWCPHATQRSDGVARRARTGNDPHGGR